VTEVYIGSVEEAGERGADHQLPHGLAEASACSMNQHDRVWMLGDRCAIAYFAIFGHTKLAHAANLDPE
jgi:hypothetical protein